MDAISSWPLAFSSLLDSASSPEGLEKTKAFNEADDAYFVYVCEKFRS